MKRIIVFLMLVTASFCGQGQTVGSLPNLPTADTSSSFVVSHLNTNGTRTTYKMSMAQLVAYIGAGGNADSSVFATKRWTDSIIGTLGGTVTSVTCGSLNPFFTASVANATTTPAITYSLTIAPARSIWCNSAGTSGYANYLTIPGTASTSTFLRGDFSWATAITGSGAVNAVPIFTGSTAIGNSSFIDSPTVGHSYVTDTLTVDGYLIVKDVPAASSTDSILVMGATSHKMRAVPAPTGTSGQLNVTWPGNVFSLSNTGTAGTYAYPISITTDAQGRVTSVTGGSAPVTGVSATLPIVSSGGTTPMLSLNPIPANSVMANTTGSSGEPTGNVPYSTSGTAASSLKESDANANISYNNGIPGFTTTATSGGSTTLTASSTQLQYFTGTPAQTITLPVTSTLVPGMSFTIVNNALQNLTLNSSGGNQVQIITAGYTCIATCISTGHTTAVDWSVLHTPSLAPGGTVTSVSDGNLSPIFTTSVATSTTTPSITHTLSNAAAYSFLANFTASSAAPTYFQPSGTPSSSNFFRGDGSWSTAVTSVTAGNGLSGGAITGTGTISMPSVGTAGTYGSATQTPVITTDAYGRVSGVTNTTITGVVPGGSAGGSLAGTYPNPTIASSVSLPGSPTTTTQGANDNSTKIATTAYVDQYGAQINTAASASSVAPNSSVADTRSMVEYNYTALAANISFNNPTGSWQNGQTLLIAILDNGTSRTLSWGTNYDAGSTVNSGTLPTSTTTGKVMLCQFTYNTNLSKFLFTGYANGY